MTQNITEISSNITKSVASLWRASTVRVRGRESLDSVFFLDKTHGWVAGERALYKLVDGADSWEKVTIDLPPYAEVADIFFVNPSLGWVALQTRVPDSLNRFDTNRNRRLDTFEYSAFLRSHQPGSDDPAKRG